MSYLKLCLPISELEEYSVNYLLERALCLALMLATEWLPLASFPVPRPAFRCLQYGKAGYCKRRKAGRGTGYEAMVTWLQTS